MTDFKIPKPTIQRIDGRLHLIREVRDDSGNVDHRVVMPLGVEFGLRDLAEIVVAFPATFSATVVDSLR